MLIFLTNESLMNPGKSPFIGSYKHDNELSGFTSRAAGILSAFQEEFFSGISLFKLQS
jgi:hypothetical protein